MMPSVGNNANAGLEATFNFDCPITATQRRRAKKQDPTEPSITKHDNSRFVFGTERMDVTQAALQALGLASLQCIKLPLARRQIIAVLHVNQNKEQLLENSGKHQAGAAGLHRSSSD